MFHRSVQLPSNLSLSFHQKGDHGICVIPHDGIVKNCIPLTKKKIALLSNSTSL